MAALQVLGGTVAAEAAEVDDPLDALTLRHATEVGRADALALGVAATSAHGVDEVVGDLDFGARPDEALRVGDVALVQLHPRRFQVTRLGAIADETAHGGVRVGKRHRQSAADESGCSGDEDATRDPSKLPGEAAKLHRCAPIFSSGASASRFQSTVPSPSTATSATSSRSPRPGSISR